MDHGRHKQRAQQNGAADAYPHRFGVVASCIVAGSIFAAAGSQLQNPLPEQLSELTSAFEERYLRKAMRKTRGHVGKCAKISGLSRRSITDKIAHYKIDKEEYKRD